MLNIRSSVSLSDLFAVLHSATPLVRLPSGRVGMLLSFARALKGYFALEVDLGGEVEVVHVHAQ